MCGKHKPGHRRRVLGEFADGIAADGAVVEKGVLGSVKVLGQGVDTKNCDSVYWADVRGSMPALVQAVGRALRMQPGEGKVASLVVPVLPEVDALAVGPPLASGLALEVDHRDSGRARDRPDVPGTASLRSCRWSGTEDRRATSLNMFK
ncbi:helicase-related protein [Streptomyces sp. NPDC090077]|uniref:helicase-related protein n=1 Tax=Streptomyces sp. NPDC090077 TaxID=3365938 RepID=UPI00380A50FB